MAARNVCGEASAPFQRAFAARALLVAFSLLFVFAIGEFFFRFVHNESDGFATTTANRN